MPECGRKEADKAKEYCILKKDLECGASLKMLKVHWKMFLHWNKNMNKAQKIHLPFVVSVLTVDILSQLVILKIHNL